MRYRSILVICSILLAISAIGQHGALHHRISDLLAKEAFDHAAVGLSVRSLTDRLETINISADQRMIPASSLKLLTTLTAIKELGPNYTFRTKIGYTGTIDQAGTLTGDLVIIGSGDPTLGSDRYGQSMDMIWQGIYTAMQAKGIKCIDGNIVVHTNVFAGQPIPGSWPYGDVGNYYGSGAWAVNWRENEYSIFFQSKVAQGKPAIISHTEPKLDFLALRSEVTTEASNTGDNAYIYGDQYHYGKIIRGTIPYSTRPFEIRGSIPNPPLSFAAVLKSYLEGQGIKIQGIEIKENPIKTADFIEIKTFSSPPLSQIITDANHESINLYCEALLRILGKKNHKEGSIEKGIETIEDALTTMDIDPYTYQIEDGSGLSPRNLITPAAFTAYVSHRTKDLGIDNIRSYLPQAGVSGTVSTLLAKRQAQKHYYLKSGSMGGVLTYTGIFQGKSQKWYAISFISNNHAHGNRAVRKAAEDIFETLYQSL